jgi:hypothetical protein
VLGVCLAVSANTLTRCTVAAIAGGGGYALRVSAALLISLALAWAAAWWDRGSLSPADCGALFAAYSAGDLCSVCGE